MTGDYTPLNYEISFTRGISPGEYQANVHFLNMIKKSKIQATVSTSLVTPDREYRKQILEKNLLNKREKKKQF